MFSTLVMVSSSFSQTFSLLQDSFKRLLPVLSNVVCHNDNCRCCQTIGLYTITKIFNANDFIFPRVIRQVGLDGYFIKRNYAHLGSGVHALEFAGNNIDGRLCKPSTFWHSRNPFHYAWLWRQTEELWDHFIGFSTEMV